MVWLNNPKSPNNKVARRVCGDYCRIDLLPPGSCLIKICYKKYK